MNNIRSYKEGEVEFKKGSTLLSGDIGSGKTSVLLAIEFALFGLQPGQRGGELLRNGEKDGTVRIDIEIDNREIRIERTLKKGKTVSQDYCSIIIDGIKEEISVTELKFRVLKLLNYPEEFAKKQNMLYKFTVYTPQEEMKQIILEDPKTRINTLRHIFGIDRYKRILENSTLIAIKMREERRRKEGMIESLEQDKLNIIEKENELEMKQSNLFSVEKELFLKTEIMRRKEEELDSIEKKIEEKRELQQEIEKTNIMIMNKMDSIFNNSKMIDELKKKIQELNKLHFEDYRITNLEREIMLLKQDKEKLREKNIQITSQMSSLQLRIKENNAVKEKIGYIEICPTCLQDVDEVYKRNVMNRLDSNNVENKKSIEAFEKENSEIYEKIKEIDLEIYGKEKELNEFRILKVRLQEIEEKQKRLEDIDKNNASLERDVKILREHCEVLKSSVFELKKFDNVYEVKNEELQKAVKEERAAEIKVAELKKEIDVFSRHIEELRKNIKKSEEIKKEMNRLMEIENWLSGDFTNLISYIEKNVMFKLKTDFSELFNKWFCMLVSDSFNARLDEDFTPVMEQQDYEIDYAYLSGGERTAVALAYRLALNQEINSFLSKIKTKDLVILDEPTDGFSEQQLDKMRDVFQQLDVGQLILVSHEQKIENFVENVLRFRKENGLTVIE